MKRKERDRRETWRKEEGGKDWIGREVKTPPIIKKGKGKWYKEAQAR